MKKRLLLLAILFGFNACAIAGANIREIKAIQILNGDIRFHITIREVNFFGTTIDSINVRADTVELYFCISSRGLPAVMDSTYTKTFTPSGTYTMYQCKVFAQSTRPNNCNFTDSNTVTHNFTLSLPLTDTAYILDVPKFIGSMETILFPNPTTGNVNVPANLKYETLLVTNTFGQTVLDAKQQPAFSLEGLPAGLYFVRFFDRQGLSVGSSRIVKQ